jgi:hypothetical protein
MRNRCLFPSSQPSLTQIIDSDPSTADSGAEEAEGVLAVVEITGSQNPHKAEQCQFQVYLPVLAVLHRMASEADGPCQSLQACPSQDESLEVEPVRRSTARG